MSSPYKFTVVSTFSGCGGSSLGYHLAGGKVLLAVEQNANAVETYRLNFPDTPIYHGDIYNLTGEEALTLAGVQPGELDILDGSPPCQGFSTAGKREFDDSRNSLFKEYVRLLKAFKPKCLVMENVSGMVKGKMRLIFAEILRSLKDSGYKVKARVLNAMYYRVPQSRQRLIFIGAREDLGIEPSHLKAQGRPITVREAIGHLPVGQAGQHTQRVIDIWRRTEPGQALRASLKDKGGVTWLKVHPDQPAPTQTTIHYHWHWMTPRKLTPTESGMLMSYPPEFHWAGSKTDIKERIGNSVPPNFMRAIAEHVYQTILAPTATLTGATA